MRCLWCWCTCKWGSIYASFGTNDVRVNTRLMSSVVWNQSLKHATHGIRNVSTIKSILYKNNILLPSKIVCLCSLKQRPSILPICVRCWKPSAKWWVLLSRLNRCSGVSNKPISISELRIASIAHNRTRIYIYICNSSHTPFCVWHITSTRDSKCQNAVLTHIHIKDNVRNESSYSHIYEYIYM